MVVRANLESEGIGGHISTYASAALCFEVGFNHFFRGGEDGKLPDMIYFQGHASPGIYARSFLEGRLSEKDLLNFGRNCVPMAACLLILIRGFCQILAISYCIDGTWSDNGNLPGKI